jgi:OOP family OmpA-OmpF porin
MIRRFMPAGVIAMLAATVLLGACSTSMRTGHHATDTVTSYVSPRLAPSRAFSDELAKQYNHYAKFETEPYYDATDMAYYHSKAYHAKKGIDVQPEDPGSWNVATPELKNAYDMLQIALVPDAKKVRTPIAAAQAQAAYDCWVEQTQEKWIPTKQGLNCRARFYEAFCRMYGGACVGTKIDAMSMARMDRIYRVFFATNRTDLNAEARAAVNKAAAAYKAGATEVLIAGHADRVGKADANQALSQRRSRAVAKALIAKGVPAHAIHLKAFGEAQPLVKTPDNVPNQNNRRALIVVR